MVIWIGLTPSRITMDVVKDYDTEGEDCYTLEVDLEYPETYCIINIMITH